MVGINDCLLIQYEYRIVDCDTNMSHLKISCQTCSTRAGSEKNIIIGPINGNAYNVHAIMGNGKLINDAGWLTLCKCCDDPKYTINCFIFKYTSQGLECLNVKDQNQISPIIVLEYK